MIYVISDIHGCYNEYKELLKKINFSDNDELFILGDSVDRGPEPMKVLQDMMMRPNVYPVLGNHDYIALKILKKLYVEINEDNAENHLSADDMMDYLYWMQDGGKITIEKFRELSNEEKEDILDYMEEFSIYEEIYVGEKCFILAHADLHGFCETIDMEKSDDNVIEKLERMNLSDFILYRAEYDKKYFEDENTFLITGHTPTFSIREDKEALVYMKNGHIAIDCGCVFGYKLAAICLNNGHVEYVNRTE